MGTWLYNLAVVVYIILLHMRFSAEIVTKKSQKDGKQLVDGWMNIVVVDLDMQKYSRVKDGWEWTAVIQMDEACK